MPPPHRRHLFGAACGAVLAGSAVTPEYDAAANELVTTQAELATLAAAWEYTTPQDALATLVGADGQPGLRQRADTVGGRHPQWRRIQAQLALVEAEALASLPGDADARQQHGERALKRASDATQLAASVKDNLTQTHAEVVYAAIGAGFYPDSQAPVTATERALRAAGESYVAPIAAAALANMYAAQHRSKAEVLAVLESVRVRAGVPVVDHGFALNAWSPGYLRAFGGAALVAAGALGPASTYLDAASEAFAPDPAEGRVAVPGVASAVQLYRAHGAMACGDVDDAAQYANWALTISQGPTAWLQGGLAKLAAAAARRGAAWPLAEV
jgi:hypothetical protein